MFFVYFVQFDLELSLYEDRFGKAEQERLGRTPRAEQKPHEAEAPRTAVTTGGAAESRRRYSPFRSWRRRA